MGKILNRLRNKLEIIFAGGQSGIGEKNGIIVKYGRDAIIVDWGQKIPNFEMFSEEVIEQKLGVPDDLCPDIGLLQGLRVLGVCATHGHMDHIGAICKIYERYPHIPLLVDWRTDKIMRMVAEKQGQRRFFSSFHDGTIYDNIPVELGPFRITRFPVNHSIIGSCGFMIEAGGCKVVITGDFKAWVQRYDSDRNKEVFGALVQSGAPDILVMDSTLSDKCGIPTSENSVARTIGEIMRKESGIIYVTMIFSNTYREQLIIKEALDQDRPVYVAGATARNFLHLAGVAGWSELAINAEADTRDGIRYDYQIAPHPDSWPCNAVILCSGSQGEPNSFLDRVARGDFYLPQAPPGVLVVAQGVTPIESVEKRFVDMISTIADRRSMQKVILPRGSPRLPEHRETKYSRSDWITSSGHGPLNHKKLVYDLLNPKITIPCHGPSHKADGRPGVRTILADAVREWGGEAVLVADGEKFTL